LVASYALGKIKINHKLIISQINNNGKKLLYTN